MNFNIESLKKNFKDVTDKTVKKTNELTAIAKLNVAIKSEESKLSDCYKAIGRLFYSAERDQVDNTEEIATYIMQADKIKATIASYQKELAILRNVVICEGCNNEIAGDAIFCPICGLKVAKPAPVVEEEAVCECEDECGCEEACDCECEEACSCEEEACECEESCACSCEVTDEDEPETPAE